MLDKPEGITIWTIDLKQLTFSVVVTQNHHSQIVLLPWKSYKIVLFCFKFYLFFTCSCPVVPRRSRPVCVTVHGTATIAGPMHALVPSIQPSVPTTYRILSQHVSTKNMPLSTRVNVVKYYSDVNITLCSWLINFYQYIGNIFS